jgi:sec-independent protein translocase protein TatA
MPFGLGIWEVVILIAVIVLVVGPAKAPGVARSLGRGAREIRETVTAPQREIMNALTGVDSKDEAKPKAAPPDVPTPPA